MCYVKKAIAKINGRYTDEQQEMVLSIFLIALVCIAILGIHVELLWEHYTNTSPYHDLRSDNWAYGTMMEMVDLGYYKEGWREGYIVPDAGVDYAGYFEMMTDFFWDDSYGSKEEFCARLGSGTSLEYYTKEFGYDTALCIYPTRYDAAKIMFNYLLMADLVELVPGGPKYMLTDITPVAENSNDKDVLKECPFRYRSAVAAVQTLNIMGSAGTKGFDGEDEMDRAQTAVVMQRMREYVKKHTTDSPDAASVSVVVGAN